MSESTRPFVVVAVEREIRPNQVFGQYRLVYYHFSRLHGALREPLGDVDSPWEAVAAALSEANARNGSGGDRSSLDGDGGVEFPSVRVTMDRG